MVHTWHHINLSIVKIFLEGFSEVLDELVQISEALLLLALVEFLLGLPELNTDWLSSEDSGLVEHLDGVLGLLDSVEQNVSVLVKADVFILHVGLGGVQLAGNDLSGLAEGVQKLVRGHGVWNELDVQVGFVTLFESLLDCSGTLALLLRHGQLVVLAADVLVD